MLTLSHLQGRRENRLIQMSYAPMKVTLNAPAKYGYFNAKIDRGSIVG